MTAPLLEVPFDSSFIYFFIISSTFPFWPSFPFGFSTKCIKLLPYTSLSNTIAEFPPITASLAEAGCTAFLLLAAVAYAPLVSGKVLISVL